MAISEPGLNFKTSPSGLLIPATADDTTNHRVDVTFEHKTTSVGGGGPVRGRNPCPDRHRRRVRARHRPDHRRRDGRRGRLADGGGGRRPDRHLPEPHPDHVRCDRGHLRRRHPRRAGHRRRERPRHRRVSRRDHGRRLHAPRPARHPAAPRDRRRFNTDCRQRLVLTDAIGDANGPPATARYYGIHVVVVGNNPNYVRQCRLRLYSPAPPIRRCISPAPGPPGLTVLDAGGKVPQAQLGTGSAGAGSEVFGRRPDLQNRVRRRRRRSRDR